MCPEGDSPETVRSCTECVRRGSPDTVRSCTECVRMTDLRLSAFVRNVSGGLTRDYPQLHGMCPEGLPGTVRSCTECVRRTDLRLSAVVRNVSGEGTDLRLSAVVRNVSGGLTWDCPQLYGMCPEGGSDSGRSNGQQLAASRASLGPSRQTHSTASNTAMARMAATDTETDSGTEIVRYTS